MTGASDIGLGRLVDSLFAETFPAHDRAEAERVGLSVAQWKSVAELGFPLVGITEEAGGSGGTLLDLLVVLQAAGRHAVPLPLAETALAAGVLADAGLEITAGPLATVPDVGGLTLRGGRLSGTASRVPWGRTADFVVAVMTDELGEQRAVRCAPPLSSIEPGSDLAGMPCDTITFDEVPVDTAAWPTTAGDPLLKGALLRSAQIAGAVTGAFELTRDYVTSRVQFGRPVSRFQSVQAHVVELAQATTSTRLCVERAGVAASCGPATFEILATKSVANRAAARAAAAAHQAHGAIGMTREYPLQLLTRRLHQWRGEFGAAAEVEARIGAAVARAGGVVALATSDGGEGGAQA
ncbi:acyl-CoA dehydrogenase family protein [Mumia qirimensis]|uniref:acyl-CoA dehydrogenase family protein n=1 Tax=Mumia qirimensis TaxID=3234852 RepID=UPI00351CC912